MTARSAAVRVNPSDPCPFCGCGTALAAHTPARKTIRKARYMPYWRHADGSTVSPVHPSIFAPFTEAAIASGRAALLTIASWQAHRDAGEYPVIVDGRSKVEWRKAA